jgi:hypothetical protein
MSHNQENTFPNVDAASAIPTFGANATMTAGIASANKIAPYNIATNHAHRFISFFPEPHHSGPSSIQREIWTQKGSIILRQVKIKAATVRALEKMLIRAQ